MKILIVEDEEINRELLCEAMAEYGTVISVATGLQALATIQDAHDQKEQFDLICLDIMMPGLDGQQTLHEIRQQEKKWGITANEQLKVIMLTALNDSHNISAAFLKGHCQAYITKPCTVQQLEGTLIELDLLPSFHQES